MLFYIHALCALSTIIAVVDCFFLCHKWYWLISMLRTTSPLNRCANTFFSPCTIQLCRDIVQYEIRFMLSTIPHYHISTLLEILLTAGRWPVQTAIYGYLIISIIIYILSGTMALIDSISEAVVLMSDCIQSPSSTGCLGLHS